MKHIQTLWVNNAHSGHGDGSYESPFTTLSKAISHAVPGSKIIVKSGTYTESVTIQVSGTLDKPIHICADQSSPGTVVCTASWYLYDVTDVIISGFTFQHIEHHAIAVIGQCERNSFYQLKFIDCALTSKSMCTFYFGGSGSSCNTVEDCRFSITNMSQDAERFAVGIMISEGDSEIDSLPNTNHIFKSNEFVNYGCAIIVGVNDIPLGNYSHIVENNSIRHCSHDGIRIKCGDTIVRGNLITGCLRTGISIVHGMSSMICDNRIQDCVIGIHIAGYDCTIEDNCIIGSTQEALVVVSGQKQGQSDHSNIIIQNNTCVNSNAMQYFHSGTDLLIDTDSSCVVRKNIFYGKSQSYRLSDTSQQLVRSHLLFIEDNAVPDALKPYQGCICKTITFADASIDDYSNTSGYGAVGRAAKQVSRELDCDKNAFTETQDGISLFDFEHSFQHRESDQDILAQSFFLEPGYKVSKLQREVLQEMDSSEDGIIDFSTWDT